VNVVFHLSKQVVGAVNEAVVETDQVPGVGQYVTVTAYGDTLSGRVRDVSWTYLNGVAHRGDVWLE